MRVTGLVLRILPTTDGLVCREQESNAEWFFGTELEGTGLGSRRNDDAKGYNLRPEVLASTRRGGRAQ